MAQRCQFTPGPGGSVQDASAGDQAAARKSKLRKDKPPLRKTDILTSLSIGPNNTMSVPSLDRPWPCIKECRSPNGKRPGEDFLPRGFAAESARGRGARRAGDPNRRHQPPCGCSPSI